MKKEFTEDQLVHIRDIFAEECEKYITLGKRDDAQQALDIINVVQSKQNCDEYDSLETWVLDDSGSYAYTEERELKEEIRDVVKQMTEYAKSSETEPSDALRNSINHYLKKNCATLGLSPKSVLYRRMITINKLIILCIKSCTDDELKKLDAIVTSLAEDRRN